MTDEERAKLRAIRDAAHDLYVVASHCSACIATPDHLEAAWQRLFALRWNCNMDDAPHGERVLLSWRDWRDGSPVVTCDYASNGQRHTDSISSVWRHGAATAWMPLPPEPGKD